MHDRFRRIIVTLFIIISSMLYILFIFFPDQVPVIKYEYAGILLCFGFSFLIYNHFLDTWTVRIALFFTAIADLFLLIMTGYELQGVTVFTIVQLIYGFRLLLIEENKASRIKTLYLRTVIIFMFQLIGIMIIQSYDPLTFMTFFYFSNLFTNVVLAFYHYKSNKIFAVGLFLFMCCDIFVGLNNSQGYLNLSSDSIWIRLLTLRIDLIWLFYYPSQILITLSILTSNPR